MAGSVRSLAEPVGSLAASVGFLAAVLLVAAHPLEATQGPLRPKQGATPSPPTALSTQTAALPLRGPAAGRPIRAAPALVPGTGVPSSRRLRSNDDRSGVSPVLLSALLPGAGQYARDERRWLGYAAAEALAWFFHLDRRGEGRELRDRYRELAWQEARQGMGPRVVGDFEYYERLTVWQRSGAWDLDDEPGLQPETDPATYNGMIWQRARGLFFGDDPGSVEPGDPEWDAALDFYRDEAYGPELLWDWGAGDDERRRFGDLIEESDDHFSTATTLLGVVLLNHFASAADAFISGRLERATGGRVESRLGIRPVAGAPRGPFGTPAAGLHLYLRIRP